jgi:orotate phosphoribosyltransferase
MTDPVEVTNALWRAGVLSGKTIASVALSRSPSARQLVITALCAAIERFDGQFQRLACPDTASLYLDALVAYRLGLPMIYLRRQAKAHGRQRQIEGAFQPGETVLLLAESATDATALAEAVQTLHAHDLRPVGIIALQGRKGAGQMLPPVLRDLPLIALLTEQADPPADLAADQQAQALGQPPTTTSPARAAFNAADRTVAEALLQIGAVTINRERPFVYASGLHSPIYTDNRLLIAHPRAWQRVLDSFTTALQHRIGLTPRSALAAMVTAGIPHAAILADRLNLPLLYVAKEEEGNGPTLAGVVAPASRIVIIEDHVTTGSSVLKTAQALRARGLRPEWCLAIFTYNFAEAASRFAASDLTFGVLCDLPTLLDVGCEKGYLTPADQAAVLDWVQDPAGWHARQRQLAG